LKERTVTNWDPEILKNPAHPVWQRHREAYERDLAMASGDDDF
jgi:hypothetical protein